MRRQLVREHRDPKGHPDLNGIDYVEISEDQRSIRVYFLAKAPDPISKNNVVISGGRRVTGISATYIDVCRTDDKDLDDCLKITVDKPGDFSDYTLRFVETDKRGRPTDRPLRGFDPRFAEIVFSFKTGCKTDLDCLPAHVCPPRQFVQPEISYLAKDYSSFRQIILDRLSLVMPNWRERHVPDLGIALVEVLAYVGDHLSYFQDAVATEAYLDTARQRISVRRHARLVDYLMHEGCNARAWVFVETNGGDVTLKKNEVAFITLHDKALAGVEAWLTHEELRRLDLQSGDYDVFEAMRADEIQLFQAHNEIHFYTWGDFECCLPRGATSATLVDGYLSVLPPPPPDDECGDDEPHQPGYDEKQHSYDDHKLDKHRDKEERHHHGGEHHEPYDHDQPEPKRRLNLHAGDVLIFEEIVSPGTGEAADVDRAHRHAVLLTKVTLGKDPLRDQADQPVVEIEWAAEDALPFPLCLSAIGNAPDCERLENVTIARGNIILVDHGRTIGRRVVDDKDPEDLGSVPARETLAECTCTSCIPEVAIVPGLFRPRLDEGPLTFGEPLPVVDPYAPDSSYDQDEYPCPKKETSAAGLLRQDPRRALPHITLTSLLPGDPSPIDWQARNDLMASGAADNHYVAEIDNTERAVLRFGDGEMGRAPQSGEHFVASYRVGNGAEGNVGPEAISHIVLKNAIGGITLQPRNPLAAAGGVEPETMDRARLFAPYAFRSELQRAITAEDYATIAARHPRVQSATAILRWTGAWYEVLVAVDPKEKAEADEKLLVEIECMLRSFRRIGHEVRVNKAAYVPLDIELKVCVKSGYLSAHVKAELIDLFSNRVLADGRVGFFHPDNLTFGAGIMLSKLVALAQSVTGVENVVATRFQRFGEPAGRELVDGILKLSAMEIARLDNDRQSPENGKIKFNMVGGR